MAIAGWTKKDARSEITRLVDLINNKGFNISQDYVLKAFLYLYKNDVRFRIKAFDNKFISLIEDKWEDIRDSIDELFEILRNFGLDRSSLTSNNATLPILYYIYHRGIWKGFANAISFVEDRERIRVWLMKTLVFRTFGNSGDRVLQASRKAFTQDMTLDLMNASVKIFPSDELSSAIKQQSELTDEFIDNHILSIHKDNSFAFAILSLLYSHLDYRNTFHKDHIHPYTLCANEGLDYNLYDTILNLQMLDSNENMSKNDKELEKWVEEQTTDVTRSAFLKVHLIPEIDLSISNFDEFTDKRRDMLHERIRKIFGFNNKLDCIDDYENEYEDDDE